MEKNDWFKSDMKKNDFKDDFDNAVRKAILKGLLIVFSLIIIIIVLIVFLFRVSNAQKIISKLEVIQDQEGIFTAYTNLKELTDDTPDITASGQKVREGIVACPRDIKFGTKIWVQDIGILECQDRMNIRYKGNYFDVYLNSYQSAKVFGRKRLGFRIIN